MKMSGARIVIECLLEQGVDTVFGYPGVSILRIYDELYKHRGRIRHILTAHEQGAAHAADGYARATGRVGVCMATSGPGATNLITGMAAAFMDSSPVVFITCNVEERLLGRDAFQEVDIVGIAMPITKSNYLVRRAEDIADVLREAFAIARSGRPGPVLVDITSDATAAKCEYVPLPLAEHGQHGRLARLMARGRFAGPDPAALDRLLAQLREARRPLLLAGGGAARTGAGPLRRLAEKLEIPVATTLMGIGTLEREHRLYAGLMGTYGCPRANYAQAHCDLLLAVGVRFSDRTTGSAERFAAQAQRVHIDIDPSEIDKNVRVQQYMVGDAAQILDALAGRAEPMRHADWAEKLAGQPLLAVAEQGEALACIRAVEAATGGEAVIVTDVGQHQLWACKYYGFRRPGQLITSGGYGAMGFGLGAAIGVQTGRPGARVVHITGDGSFRMNFAELATARCYGLPVVTVILNNRVLGMVRQNQRASCHGRYSQTDLDRPPDFVRLAEAFDLPAVRVDGPAALETALRTLLEAGRGGVIDCPLDRDASVPSRVQDGILI